MDKNIYNEIAILLQNIGIERNDISWGTQITIFVAALVITFLCTKLFRHIVIPIIHKITARTKAKWDDYLVQHRNVKAFSRMIPPIMLYALLPFAFDQSPKLLDFTLKVCLIYLDIVTILLVGTFLNSLYNISSEHEKLRNRPLKGIYQMIKLITITIGIIILISILMDQDPTSILAGLGASAAVLMLIFKDSILGLVAGVQRLQTTCCVPGDWITMTKYGADGYVIEVSLTTVKVQNFDKTITTIPPYALVSDSFQNWRGMRETGGRRIKRSINIDMNTVHFCTPEEIQSFIDKGLIDKKTDINEKTVNLAIFRNYILNYLNNHPKVNKDLMIMVRQMQPASEGMPLEIYCFSDTPDWIPYEALQSEIFEHVMAMVQEFNLRIFQRPTGTDFKA